MEWHDRIGRRLTLRNLHTLVTVARRGSMAKGAAELALTQPAVSKMVADMEHTFGVRLLDRKPQGVEPTLYGQALLKWGDAVFEDLRHAVREIQSLADPDAGEIRIGGNSPMLEGLLPAAIDRLSRQYPRIVFHLTQVIVAAQSFEDLRARKFDLIVGRIPQRFAQEDLSVEVLFEEPMCVTLQFTYAMVATGRFLGMFPRSLLHFGGKRFAIKVLPVKLPIKPPPVAIVTLKNRTVSPAVERFIECLRSVAKPLAGRSKRRI